MKKLLPKQVSVFISQLLHCKFKWLASVRTISVQKLNDVDSQKFTKKITRTAFTRFPK
jgi:hypothetical protein